MRRVRATTQRKGLENVPQRSLRCSVATAGRRLKLGILCAGLVPLPGTTITVGSRQTSVESSSLEVRLDGGCYSSCRRCCCKESKRGHLVVRLGVDSQ